MDAVLVGADRLGNIPDVLAEFAAETNGYTATRHQREVGTGYFDQVAMAVSGGSASTVALKESTESDQFKKAAMEAAE